MKARSKSLVEKLESRILMSAWSTVDSYQLVPGGTSIPRAMASDSAGNVYAAGRSTDSAGVAHAIIREMFSGSGTWTTIEDTTSYACFRAMTVDAKGDIFVSTANAQGGNAGWVVLERPAGQSAFSQVDTVSGGEEVFGLTTDASGDVFAAGAVSEPTYYKKSVSYYTHWVAREWKAGATGFTTVDDYLGSGNSSTAYGIGIVSSGPSAGIYVVGVSWVPGSTYGIENWFVRKSADGGQTWGTVDSFVYGPPASPGSVAYAVAGDRSGNVYVVGEGFDHSTYTQHWVVRKSSTGNLNSWSVNDDFLLPTTQGHGAGADAIGTDLSGNMYVAGSTSDTSGINHAIVRSNVGGSWATVDDYSVGGSAYSNTALTVDSGGNVYTAGGVLMPNYTWVVRSQPAAPTNLTATSDVTFPSSQIDLAWNNAAGGDETGFEVYRSTDGINFAAVASVGSSVTTYSDSGLSPGTKYYYYVVTLLNATGMSGASNTASATTST